MVRGPATLRYGSQAIGGVVNAVNTRIPTAIPVNGILVETRGGFSSVDEGRNGAAIVEAGSGNFVIHADTFARSANDYRIPSSPGRQANTSLDSSGYSLGGSYVFKDGFVGVAYSSFASTYFIPGIEAAERKNHIVLEQSKLASRGEWRVNDFGVEAIRFWFGATDYKHDETDFVPVFVIGSTFLQKQYETRVEVQHQPVKTALGRAARRLRHAVVRPRPAGRRRRRHPAQSDQHAKPRRLHLRGAAADQEAALPGGRPHRERRRQGHGLDLPAGVSSAAR